MKTLLATYSFLLLNALCSAQTFRIDMKVARDDDGVKTITVKDTSLFEYYYYCSMNQGLRLKPNLPDGKYEVYANDTLSYAGCYSNNKMHGVWTYYFSNGTLFSVVTYKDGKENGPYKEYYKNGVLSSTGNYLDGREAGNWSYYDEGGKLVREQTFD
ncbi:MAG: hypothetical protein WAQ28_20485 [Bacteroidia bacterium]